jgi:hypothetical protein
MPTGQHELKALGTRLPEYRKALTFAPTSHVIFELLVKTIVPRRVDHSFKDRFDKIALIGVVEIAQQRRFGDVPIIGYPCSQQPSILGRMVPIKTYSLSLILGESVVEGLYQGLRGRARRRSQQISGWMTQTACKARQRQGTGCCEEFPAMQTISQTLFEATHQITTF